MDSIVTTWQCRFLLGHSPWQPGNKLTLCQCTTKVQVKVSSYDLNLNEGVNVKRKDTQQKIFYLILDFQIFNNESTGMI
jgi:hypothetical protein